MTTLREMSPNDLANLITISSSALGTVLLALLVLFKSRCKTISFCCGLWKCDREVVPLPIYRVFDSHSRVNHQYSRGNAEWI